MTTDFLNKNERLERLVIRLGLWAFVGLALGLLALGLFLYQPTERESPVGVFQTQRSDLPPSTLIHKK